MRRVAQQSPCCQGSTHKCALLGHTWIWERKTERERERKRGKCTCERKQVWVSVLQIWGKGEGNQFTYWKVGDVYTAWKTDTTHIYFVKIVLVQKVCTWTMSLGDIYLDYYMSLFCRCTAQGAGQSSVRFTQSPPQPHWILASPLQFLVGHWLPELAWRKRALIEWVSVLSEWVCMSFHNNGSVKGVSKVAWQWWSEVSSECQIITNPCSQQQQTHMRMYTHILSLTFVQS